MIPISTMAAALAGGMLIGLAAAVLWLGLGRIAGISGIAGALLSPATRDRAWRIAFLIGLIGAPAVLNALNVPIPARHPIQSWPLLILAGLLVGFGTALGSGCTSGHGVCGLARLSKRSIAATSVFMATALITVFLVHGSGS